MRFQYLLQLAIYYTKQVSKKLSQEIHSNYTTDNPKWSFEASVNDMWKGRGKENRNKRQRIKGKQKGNDM